MRLGSNRPTRRPPPPHPPQGLPPRPPASIAEARSLRDALAGLIHRERAAAADFLVALADFDQRRGWAALGHQSLFAFLSRELHLSDGAAFVRVSAARLIARFPAVETALRQGRLCLSTAGSLAGVLKPENQAELLPRFFGLSARQAKELVATLVPRENPPQREVLSRLPQNPLRTSEVARHEKGANLSLEVPEKAGEGFSGTAVCDVSTPTSTPIATPAQHSTVAALPIPPGERAVVRGAVPTPTPTVADLPLPAGERAGVRGTATAPPLSTIEPLSADLHRLHLTVSTRLVKKLAAAKDGLAHAIPGATTEQVLEAALDLLLERQARRKGLVKRPRTAASTPAGMPASAAAGAPGGTAAETAAGKTDGLSPEVFAAPTASAVEEPATGSHPGQPPVRPRSIPAAIRREVWLRDGQRCQHPLDSGGTCGATARLELDHIVPLALGGPSTAGNLRVVCGFHNRAAARAILGDALVEDGWTRGRRRRAGQA